jgi:hypothetical protein
MANKIILKKSAVSGKVPLNTDLEYGELALNYHDGALYYRKNDDTVHAIGGGNGYLYVQTRNTEYIQVPIVSGFINLVSRSGNIQVPA